MAAAAIHEQLAPRSNLRLLDRHGGYAIRNGTAGTCGIQFSSCSGSAMLTVEGKRGRGMAEYDSEYFQRQFEGLPPSAVAIIALRASMRVLPVLAYRRSVDAGPFAYWKKGERAQHALALFRCFEVSLFVNDLTKSGSVDVRAADTAHAVANTAHAAANATGGGAVYAAYAARAAANAAYAAAAAHAHAPAETGAAIANAVRAASFATAAYAAAGAAIASAILNDTERIKHLKRSWLVRQSSKTTPQAEIPALLASPLWPEGMPTELQTLSAQIQIGLQSLGSGFEVWIDWYRDRLDGKPCDWKIEAQWALLSKEQLSQSPAEINAYLKGLREGALTKQLKRVRAIFIGHGEVGKTSLIRALHGEDVVEGNEAMTQGIATTDSSYKLDEQAGVFTRVTAFKEADLTVHFWDFGGQVMAHATHQFFLRSKCLYVIVLAGRAERNPNEEAEYWLEHVRAFGDNAPVLIVGNKADVMPVNIDLRSLTEKYPNIAGFYSISCTGAKGGFRAEFVAFCKKLAAQLKALGEVAERFSPAQFSVLKAIEDRAEQQDFLPEMAFDEICVSNGIALEGPGGRASLLDIFDKLGIVMHFEKLPFLTDYVLNPRWLTYGVYTIMYSEEARAARGRIAEASLVPILKKANLTIPNGRSLRYPADKCRLIADAMIAFRVAYRLGTGELVIPALLAPAQPEHDFRPEGALAFRLNFGGFLPRHILPALIVEHFQDIAIVTGREIVWQNGVLFRPKRRPESEAFVSANYHTRTLDILVKGPDANLYLGVIRDSILRTLETMPQLRFEELIELRPGMRLHADGPSRDTPVWMPYRIIWTALKNKLTSVPGPDGHLYDMDLILAAMPTRPHLCEGDVFLSYSSKDGGQIESLANELEGKRVSVWFDRGLIAGQPYRDVLQQRIETVKAVVVLWTENSIGSKWVRAEANLADHHGKLICLRDPKLDAKRIPMPFAEVHMIEPGKLPDLLEALALKGAKPRI